LKAPKNSNKKCLFVNLESKEVSENECKVESLMRRLQQGLRVLVGIAGADRMKDFARNSGSRIREDRIREEIGAEEEGADP
jgi:D-Tyr-tRNAtyr deacylase